MFSFSSHVLSKICKSIYCKKTDETWGVWNLHAKFLRIIINWKQFQNSIEETVQWSDGCTLLEVSWTNLLKPPPCFIYLSYRCHDRNENGIITLPLRSKWALYIDYANMPAFNVHGRFHSTKSMEHSVLFTNLAVASLWLFFWSPHLDLKVFLMLAKSHFWIHFLAYVITFLQF